MSKLVDHAEKQAETFTKQASTVSRSLGITAVALVWLFAAGLLPSGATPEMLLDRVRKSDALAVALFAAVASLGLDMLQYAWASLAWNSFHRRVDAILDVDTGAVPISEPAKHAWKKARHTLIVRRLERAAGIDRGKSKFDSRRDVLRQKLHPQDGAEIDGGLVDLMNRPAAPGFIVHVTGFFFVLKTAAIIVSYVALGIFFD